MNAKRLMLKFSASAFMTYSTCVRSALLSPIDNPNMVKAIPVIANAVRDTGIIPRTWSITSISAIAAERTQLSESGESLSPKYAPERTAPAVTGAGTPIAEPIPIIAIPAVPTVPHDVPVASEVIPHSISVAGRNTAG